MSAPIMSNSAGAVFGRYVLVQSIRPGAMGEVWVAIDLDLDRKVALKLLRRDRIEHTDNRELLLAEARAMARLTHPHVVTIHDVGEVEGQLFIAMEYVDGGSLDEWLKRGPYAWQDALEVLRQAGAGLAAAHDVGLVHRNFKPANVMIGKDGRVRVLDFGLARTGATRDQLVEREASPHGGRRPSTGGFHGREDDPGPPHYMSPEQQRGEQVDARADIFSFCVVLFEALYGARPFAGSGQMLEIAADERAPAWVHRVVTIGLATDPSQRFDDMQMLLRALERSPTQKRRRRRAIAGSLAMGVGIIALALALTPERDDPCDMQAARAQVQRPALEAQLRARVDGRTPAGSLVSQRLSEGLDRSATAWTNAQVQLCRDRRAKRITPRIQQVRERCLAERREAIVALTNLGSAGDDADAALLEALAARPYAALRSLGDATQCTALGISRTDAPALAKHGDDDDPRRRAIISLALALAPVGLDQIAAAELARAPVEADDDPERALLFGRLAAAAGDRKAAERRLHAVAQATTDDQHQLAVKAWLALIELELTALDAATPADIAPQLRAATRLLDYAEALADPSELALHSQLALLRGRLALALDQGELALPKLDEAIERAELEPTRDADLLAALLSVRASLLREPEAAAADRGRAQAVLRQALGPS